MDLSLFATQVLQTGENNKAGLFGTQTLGGNANGLPNNLNFLQAILDNIATDQDIVSTGGSNTESETTSDKVKNETVDLALLQLALLGQDPDQNIDEKLAELRIERIKENSENRVEQLTKLINHLTNGLVDTGVENGNIADLVRRLENRLEKLEAKLDSFRTGDFGEDGAPFKLLIATGLNPAQLTKITDRIEEVETKLGRELTVEDLIAGVGNIIPAPGDEDHELATTDALDILQDHIEEEENADDLIAAELNDIVVGGAEAGALANTGKESLSPLIGLTPKILTSGDGASGTASTQIAAPAQELIGRLSNEEFNALFGNAKAAAKNNTAKPDFTNLLDRVSLPTNVETAAIKLPVNFAELSLSQSLLSETLGFDIQTGTPFTTTLQAAHAASSSIPQAGQSHPATQTVAAQISKAAQNGDSRNITLHLDPPELGRVEVRLEFGDDRSVKAHMIVEKPETLLMLQRDTSALERALQNAGLETDSGSLNYEMAGDDYAFGGGQDGHNGHGKYGNGGSNDETADDDLLIEATMTWDVDPETGHVHYSILA